MADKNQADTAKVEPKAERKDTAKVPEQWSTIMKYGLPAIAAFAALFGGSYTAASQSGPTQNERNAVVKVEAEVGKISVNLERFASKFELLANAVQELAASVKADKAAYERRLSDLEAANKELRADLREHDKRIAKIEGGK